MASANASWIRAHYYGGEELRALDVTVYGTGFSFAGVVEQFRYKATPADHAEYERKDDGIAITEQQPVTEPPHHWYWWKVDR